MSVLSLKKLPVLGLILLLLAGWGPAGAEEEKPRPKREPWRISEVKFVGFDNLSLDQVKAVMEVPVPGVLNLSGPARYDSLAVDHDEKRLTQLYHEYGFFQATVEATVVRDHETRMVSITFEAHEQNPSKVEGIEFIFPNDQERESWEDQFRKNLPLKIGHRFTLDAYEQAKARIGRVMSDEAHPRHELEGQVRAYPSEEKVVVVFKVNPGPRVLFGATTITGNKRIATKIIAREITYARGEPFSLAKIDAAQRALLSTGFFISVNFTPQYRQMLDNQAPMVLTVEERDPYSLRLGLGWGTEDQFRVRIMQINRDPLGVGDVLSFEGKISSIYEGLLGHWQFPHIPAKDQEIHLIGGIEQQDNEAYVGRKYLFRPRWEIKWWKKWSWYIGYNVEKDRMVDLKANVPDPAYENQTFFISSIPVGLRWDNRDSVLNPTRGTLLELQVETSLSAFESDLEFVRPVADLSHVWPITGMKQWYLAGRAEAGFCFPLGSTERIPLIRRFFPGGADSVRGYPYQSLGPLDSGGKPLGGEAALVGNLEVRFPLWKELGGVVFVDAGNAYENVNSDMGQLRYTTGCGLRYNTPVGPLRLDFGYQLNPPTDANIPRYQVYLSVGQAF